MKFFDCNAFFGLPSLRPLMPAPTTDELLAEMDRAGVERALVWHIAQHDGAPRVGNQLLAEAIAPHPRLVGCWTVLPNQAREFPPPAELFRQMQASRVAALRVFPNAHKFLLNTVSMGDLLEAMTMRRVPLFVSVKRGMAWHDVYNLLAEFPALVCVICDHGCWGEDRMFRPLLERYPNVYVDTAQYLLDGGIEALVADYGPRHILFGSGFPESYFGGMMMALRHAQISDEAKALIAGGNLERIIDENLSTDLTDETD
ncbi:MAG TPA: amidohydrolase family protein [Anaerolineae bacterium]|nr:amidohydrolase family protein [Anaerolineae bacterium]HQI85549.1 amidohydrolase family protein [Anaerolineae bacterium]